ncbi:Man1-Src1p-C-terminal domain-containing protein [Ordospora colligata]|uniref:Man1-Src1p-C-terminal domain-containing protein n=1 Tax=Ordospora colligata OC4 TaxID=1354746 RepID=A0A0B2UIY5_9MICR|nr:Man1-Src1p-C-terminal domain-containing protein [Ordospora colligata OC4]KHN68945.1 Man1-Src1p-C-terminal domain-containing protein [Ordospora colligata OC4]TBU14168.1 Man1-Src1p-C-terminal domain-containing protein [Ordospora colligata]TBU17837.1 Man1-Src1p-C-terminal domain-containing protein [Ordospora colligata]
MTKDIGPEEYLCTDFDYSKLTKTQLRKIMYENGVEDSFPITCKKQRLLDAYKRNIHEKIEELKAKKGKISMDNPFQKAVPSKAEIEMFENVSEVKSPERAPKAPKISIRMSPKSGGASEKHDTKIKHKKHVDKSTAGMPLTANVSGLDFCNSSISSSLMLSGSSENGIEMPRKSDDVSSSDVRRRAYTSDPTLDKLESKTKRSGTGAKQSSGVTISSSSMNGWKMIYAAVIVALISGLVYIRIACPYCINDAFMCIKQPEHSRIVDGKLVCDDGFVVKHGLVRDYCVKDDRHERMMAWKIHEIKKYLERRNGEYSYGMASSRMVPIDTLTKEPELVERIKNQAGIVVLGNMMYSIKAKAPIRIFVRYYMRMIIAIAIPLGLMIAVAKMIRSINRKKEERQYMARKVVRDISDVLVRQIYVSTKNTNFPSYVYIEQLRDCFGINKKVWADVEKMVATNSNIRKMSVENKKAWEWVGPILYKPEFNGSLF